MDRLAFWYAGLSHWKKRTMIAAGIAVAVLAVAAIAYVLLMPKKVEVTFGTIRWDPISGEIFSDDTQTITVDADKAADYKVVYEIQYNDEHAALIAAEEARLKAEADALAEQTGLQPVQMAFNTDTINDLNTLQRNIEVYSQQVLTGMEIANEWSATQATLINARDQLAAMPVPEALAGLKQQSIDIMNMYIDAIDCALQYVATGDQRYATQAQALAAQANSRMQALAAPFQQQQ